MATNNTVSTLRRSAPSVVQCFKNAQLYRREEVREGEPGGSSRAGPPPGEVVALFTWLGAKQKHAHKYAKCWTRRGHDVLYVTTSVRDLLMPRTGAEVTAGRVLDFLDQRGAKVIVHGLSVGGYLTQRVLMAARESHVDITHTIFDSFTNCSGMEAGVQNAVSPRYRGLAKALVKLYVKHTDLSSVYEAQKFAVTTPCRAPSLFLHSLCDEVSPYKELEPIVTAQQKASPTTAYFIPEELRIPHVSLLKYLGEEKYMGYIDKFIETHRGTVVDPDRDYSSLATVEYITDIPPQPCPERILVPQ